MERNPWQTGPQQSKILFCVYMKKQTLPAAISQNARANIDNYLQGAHHNPRGLSKFTYVNAPNQQSERPFNNQAACQKFSNINIE